MSYTKEERKAYMKAWNETNRERENAKAKARYQNNIGGVKENTYYKNNREKVLAYQRRYYINVLKDDRENQNKKQREWYAINKDRLSILSAARARKRWKTNPDIMNYYYAKRRAMKRNLVPEHLKKCRIEKQRIINIYKLRNLMTNVTGIKHHIDHMWPLIDGGPHWSGNLQIIPAYDNQVKGANVCPELKQNIQKSLDLFRREMNNVGL